MMLRIFEPVFEDIDEPYRSLYVEHVDGTWRLDCDIEVEIKGLKSALRKERETRHELEKRTRHLTTKDGAEALVAFNGTLRATTMAKGSDAN